MKFPARVYTWVGCCTVAVAPSPNSQDHAVGVPFEVSVNLTASGALPAVAFAVNLASGTTRM